MTINTTKDQFVNALDKIDALEQEAKSLKALDGTSLVDAIAENFTVAEILDYINKAESRLYKIVYLLAGEKREQLDNK